MKPIRVFTRLLYLLFISILLSISTFPHISEAKDWKPIREDPSPYFFLDRQRNEWILIEGVCAKDRSFQKGISIYRSVDGKSFSPLVIEGYRTEEISINGNLVRRNWILLKDPKDEIKYELSHSKIEWEKEPRQNYEALLLTSDSFGDNGQKPHEYTRTHLSGEEIRSLTIQKQ